MFLTGIIIYLQSLVIPDQIVTKSEINVNSLGCRIAPLGLLRHSKNPFRDLRLAR